jgi:flavin reductase (DIM6/NTAB) family NADH-FMN oxidoreductase RutF
MASKIVEVGNCSGRDVDKFEAFHLTQIAAERVTAPLIGECFANLECTIGALANSLWTGRRSD